MCLHSCLHPLELSHPTTQPSGEWVSWAPCEQILDRLLLDTEKGRGEWMVGWLLSSNPNNGTGFAKRHSNGKHFILPLFWISNAAWCPIAAPMNPIPLSVESYKASVTWEMSGVRLVVVWWNWSVKGTGGKWQLGHAKRWEIGLYRVMVLGSNSFLERQTVDGNQPGSTFSHIHSDSHSLMYSCMAMCLRERAAPSGPINTHVATN